MASDAPSDPSRLRAAIRLVLRRYVRQVRVRPWLAALSLLLPGIGNIFVFYVPPLAIARLLTTLAHDPHAAWTDLTPSVALLAIAWLGGETIWRVAGWLLQRFEY